MKNLKRVKSKKRNRELQKHGANPLYYDGETYYYQKTNDFIKLWGKLFETKC